MVLIAAVLLALVGAPAAVAAAVASFIAAVEAMLAALATAGFALLAGLAALLGLSSSAIAADAQSKGVQKQSGMLDSTVAWFKSWF